MPTTISPPHSPFTESLLSKYGPVMDVSDLAEALRITKSGLYKQIDSGHFKLPHFKNGKKYLFATVDIGDHLSMQKGAA
jgi:hypothetical protein